MQLSDSNDCVSGFSDSLAFATEPIVGSLANFLGNYERMPTPIPSEIKVSWFLCAKLSRKLLPFQAFLEHIFNDSTSITRPIVIIMNNELEEITCDDSSRLGVFISEKLYRFCTWMSDLLKSNILINLILFFWHIVKYNAFLRWPWFLYAIQREIFMNSLFVPQSVTCTYEQ